MAWTWFMILQVAFLHLSGRRLAVGLSCDFKLEWKRWAWSHHYDQDTNTKMWTLSFGVDGNIRLQNKGPFATAPATDLLCSDMVTEGDDVYIYADRQVEAGQTSQTHYCLHFITAGHFMLMRQTPVTAGQSDCKKHEDETLPFVILYRRPLIKCSESAVHTEGWAFYHERSLKKVAADAERDCFRWAGGHLAWFKSAEEFFIVTSFIQKFTFRSGTKYFGTISWLLGYTSVGNNYMTFDGDASPSFFNWNINEPGSRGACVVARADRSYLWEDALCSTRHAYLCKARCYDSDYFSMPKGKCPFSSHVGQRKPVYYQTAKNGPEMCKGDRNSLAIFTGDEVTFNTCTDSNVYELPVQSSLTCVGTVNGNSTDKEGTMIFAQKYGAVYTFRCARYKEDGDLYISLDVTDYKQPSCRPQHTYRSVGHDPTNGGKYVLLIVDLVDDEEEVSTKKASSTALYSHAVTDTTETPIGWTLPTGSSNTTSIHDETSSFSTVTLSGEGGVPGTAIPVSGGISPLGVGMIVLAVGLLIGVMLFILLCSWCARNRFRMEKLGNKPRNVEKTEEVPADDDPDGFVITTHRSLWGGTLHSGYAPSYGSFRA